MLILNYAHPLTAEHRAQIAALVGQDIEEVRDLATHLDVARPFAEHARALADAAGLAPEAWQTRPLVVVPPALNVAALALVAELHGRMGYFPPVVRLRPVEHALPPRFEVAEIVNLQEIRAAARQSRSGSPQKGSYGPGK